jgi:hypothetical protein
MEGRWERREEVNTRERCEVDRRNNVRRWIGGNEVMEWPRRRRHTMRVKAGPLEHGSGITTTPVFNSARGSPLF